MLVLSRKVGEIIKVGTEIKVTLVRISGNTVRIGIEAPPNVVILRAEVGDETDDSLADDVRLPSSGHQPRRQRSSL